MQNEYYPLSDEIMYIPDEQFVIIGDNVFTVEELMEMSDEEKRSLEFLDYYQFYKDDFDSLIPEYEEPPYEP